MSVKFRRVYYNGVYVVAEFEDEMGYPPNRIFPLNAGCVEERIKNKKKLGLDVKEEKKALSKIMAHKDYKPE